MAFNYKQQYSRLKGIHNFTFNLRQKLTPQRKAAIRKAHNKYNKILHAVENGRYTFVETTPSQNKNLREQYPYTNKGIIYNKPVDKGTVRTTKIFGRGKNINLVDDVRLKFASDKNEARKITFYIQFPPDFMYSELDIWIEYIRDLLEPDYISVAINGYAGSQEVLPSSFGKYAEDLRNKLKNKNEGAEDAVTGLYVIFYIKRLNNQWLKEKEKLIESLF
jgi:hypothetical protein